MFKIKGIYRWKLIDVKTGKVNLEGEQENLITDSLLENFTKSPGNTKSSHTGRIVLSTTSTPLPPPSYDYRDYGEAEAAIASTTMSGWIAYTYDDPAGLEKVSYNFPPPGGTTIYNIMGLDLGADILKFQSFIELTTPITQLITESLYVEYSMTAQFAGGLLNSPNNAYFRDYVNEEVWEKMYWFAYRNTHANNYIKVTPFRYPNGVNNVGRRVGFIDSIADTTPPNNGCRYGQDITKSYVTTDIPGPIGCPIWMYFSDDSPRPNAVAGVFNTNAVPSISRVFIHPGANKDQVFSDPAHPPLSRGAITVTGTPTNPVPIVMRPKITKTGDASDVVDETFTATPGSDVINVTQSEWADDDIAQFTTTNTLPDPLATSTDYYLINGAGGGPYTFEVSTSQGGSKIDITDTGTGTHTIIRQNTGEYKLTMEPCITNLNSNTINGVSAPYGTIDYQNIKAIVDTSGSSTPNDWYLSERVAVIGREGEYIYTVQYDATQLQLMICRQYIFSPESSEPLHSLFGTSGVALWCAVRGAGSYSNIVYIATDDGIYLYNFSLADTPVLIILTGWLLLPEVTDLAYDSVNDKLYAGHTKGMTRIDITSATAGTIDNAYDNDSSSNLLSGLTNTQIDCQPGALSAHNGRILWARVFNDSLWLYDDSYPGYTKNASLSNQYGGIINKSDDRVVTRTHTSALWASWIVNVTGPTTGDWTQEDAIATGWPQFASGCGQMLQLSPTKFLSYVGRNSSTIRPEIYEVGVGATTFSDGGLTQPYVSYTTSHVANIRNANMRNGIDLTDGNMGLYVQIQDYKLLNFGSIVEYGWDSDSTAWSKDSTISRQITESGVDDLSQGVAVQFNNAVGEDWDEQFVLDEHLTFMVSPVLVKDNLQTYTVNTRAYHCGVKHITDETHVVPAGQKLVIDKAPLGLNPDPDYRDLETLDWVLGVYNKTSDTTMAQVASPPGNEQYSVVGLRDGTFEFDSSQISDNIRFNYNYTVYF